MTGIGAARTPPGVDELVSGTNPDPHGLLGPHENGTAAVVRCWHPDAAEATVHLADGPVPARRVGPGVFEAPVAELPAPGYEVEVATTDGTSFSYVDPYAFWPTLGDIDLHLFGEGRHERLWTVLGAHHRIHQGVSGTSFSVWAPEARSVRVVGDWNAWDGRVHPMRQIGASGVWELFVPGVAPGDRYKFELLLASGEVGLRADPYAQATERPPATASVVTASSHEWHDDEWMERRRDEAGQSAPHSVYEVHLGSWRRIPEEGDRSLTYREAATQLAEYVADLGFSHVELMAVAEHPYEPSWGYQVTGYYAPNSRFGTPDGLRELIDVLHQHDIGVILDWVPAHFPRDAHALRRFDGSALYEHADPRQGEHPDWGTMVFNVGRAEVRNFLLANALYWLEEFHVDGLRVDAVASMIYLDYSRTEGEWVPNVHGGRENLEAIAFLQEVNTVVHRVMPGVLTIAEESTAWDGVTRPVHHGGLGFTHKWNMGWMHDTLGYFAEDPVHRRYHHDELTFGLVYAWSEHFVLPLSHDEVVHGKGSLLGKMPGDHWQRFANLRALFGWMWAHPGKQLVFMGGELAQEQEWSEGRSVDWHLLDDEHHAGVQRLVRSLNHLQAAEPALWRQDFSPDGFGWIDASDRDQSVYAFLRLGDDGDRPVACIANLTPVPRHGYRIGLPVSGEWREVLNTDDPRFGGSGVGQAGVTTEPEPWHGHPQSAVLTLPPLAVTWLAPEAR